MIGLVSSGVVLAVGFLLVGRHPPMGAAHTVSALPLVNAWLNGTSALLLAVGYWFIRQRKVTAHKICMVRPLASRAASPVSYVIYHYHAGSKPFGGHGWIRGVYYPLLISHLILAAWAGTRPTARPYDPPRRDPLEWPECVCATRRYQSGPQPLHLTMPGLSISTPIRKVSPASLVVKAGASLPSRSLVAGGRFG
jgi:hypothetical protein